MLLSSHILEKEKMIYAKNAEITHFDGTGIVLLTANPQTKGQNLPKLHR